jgi:putative phosphoesterase
VRRIGLISDTHGLLRPQVVQFLEGCEHIIHAGDICDAAILERLSALAPVTAVRGNNDFGSWAEALHETELVRVDEVGIYVIHDLALLNIGSSASGIDVIVSGHSHKPHAYRRDGMLYVNPGSVGPRRFSLPVAAAELLVDGAEVTVNHREFAV